METGELVNRRDMRWAVQFAMRHFHLSPVDLETISGPGVRAYLDALWARVGEEAYSHPMYALRQEYVHTGPYMRRIPVFFMRLPKEATVLDYGCGTAEMPRLDWIDRGGRTVLVDLEGPNFDYLRAKYPQPTVRHEAVNGGSHGTYDAVICTHVFEHIPEPIRLLEQLWENLKPGGNALFWFDEGHLALGHLPDAINQKSDYLDFLVKHTERVAQTSNYDWVKKPQRKVWQLWHSSGF